jgi:selenide,water dikinase
VLAQLPEVSDPRLLVGTGTFDDAGVLQVREDLALVQSVDFFPPVVDDPFDFGRIAAANALSDIYAMGGRPLCALAVCAFPSGTLPLDVLRDTLAGGLSVMQAEGVVPLGGHTVKGPEFTYGLAVTGLVDPQRVLTNAGAAVGDALVLTKAIGTGVLATALKREQLDAAGLTMLVESMATTNRLAAEVCVKVGVHALTDITGFGLLGHALEMAEASRVCIEIDSRAVPLMPGALAAAGSGAVPGGLVANRTWIERRVSLANVDLVLANLLCDPQTSGGLFAAVGGGQLEAFLAAANASALACVVVGEVVDGEPGTLLIR